MANNSKFFISDGASCYEVKIVASCTLGYVAVIKGNKRSRFPESRRIVIKEEFFTPDNIKRIKDGSNIQVHPMMPHIEQDVALQQIVHHAAA